MSITGAIVIFASIWFVTLLCILPVGMKSQADAGEIAPGTPASAPSEAMIGRKMLWTTAITVVLWAVICGVIFWSGLTVRDLDVWHRM